MKKFCIITNRYKDEKNEVTNRVADYLKQGGKTVCYKENDGTSVESDVDCIVVLGGDGTLLKAAGDSCRMEVPLVGVNLGTLGYLSCIEKENIETALDQIISEKYLIETRMMISGQIDYSDGEKGQVIPALNDIVISRGGTSHIVRFHISINGQYLNTYYADGVIVSTPTGSTSYNLSAGGPIVEPNANLIMVTPICPHTLNTRSIVFSENDEVTIQIEEGKKEEIERAEVNFDGNHTTVLEVGDRITIKKSELTTKLMKLDEISFLRTLHRKMAE